MPARAASSRCARCLRERLSCSGSSPPRSRSSRPPTPSCAASRRRAARSISTSSRSARNAASRPAPPATSPSMRRWSAPSSPASSKYRARSGAIELTAVARMERSAMRERSRGDVGSYGPTNPDFAFAPSGLLPTIGSVEPGIFPALDAVDELKGPIWGLVDGPAGEDPARPPAMQVKEMGQPGVDQHRVGADVHHLHVGIHGVDAGKDDVELVALNVDIEEIDPFRHQFLETDRRHLFDEEGLSSLVSR